MNIGNQLPAEVLYHSMYPNVVLNPNCPAVGLAGRVAVVQTESTEPLVVSIAVGLILVLAIVVYAINVSAEVKVCTVYPPEVDTVPPEPL